MIQRLLSVNGRVVVAGVGIALLTGLIALVVTGTGTKNASAYFPTAVGVYDGSEVRLMGVPIGHVTAVDPLGTRVRIDMEYDADYRLPANAEAVIVSPSLVSDRFVQFTPPYSGSGAVLADHAVIPQSRTHVPVELDEIYGTANDLLKGLGPQTRGDNGSVDRLLEVSADNLEGQGREVQTMIRELSAAMGTLAESSPDTYAAVGHLEKFTRMLVAEDKDVRKFNNQMADVSDFLADERENLSAALEHLASTFAQVNTFVRQNRALLGSNVNQLTKITGALVAEKEALVAVERILPVAGSNTNRSWVEATQSISARPNEAQLLKDLDNLLCDAFVTQGLPEPQALCSQLGTLLEGLGLKQ